MKQTIRMDIVAQSKTDDVHIVKVCYQFTKNEIKELQRLCKNRIGITFMPVNHLLEILAKHDVLRNVESCGDTYDREYILDAIANEFLDKEDGWPTFGEGGIGDIEDKQSFINKLLTAIESRGYQTVLSENKNASKN